MYDTTRSVSISVARIHRSACTIKNTHPVGQLLESNTGPRNNRREQKIEGVLRREQLSAWTAGLCTRAFTRAPRGRRHCSMTKRTRKKTPWKAWLYPKERLSATYKIRRRTCSPPRPWPTWPASCSVSRAYVASISADITCPTPRGGLRRWSRRLAALWCTHCLAFRLVPGRPSAFPTRPPLWHLWTSGGTVWSVIWCIESKER